MNRQSHGREHMLAALSSSQAYPHPADRLGHLHTHISDVFLAGAYAYKIKKPVNLGFLDFTTLSSRRRACEDEVRLNRRLAPLIYLGVATIRESQGNYTVCDQLDTTGADIDDFAVKMVRMPQERMLDKLATTGKLGRDQMHDIARQLAHFHNRAERGPDIDAYGSLGNIADNVRQNFVQIEPYIDRSITRARFARIRSYAEKFISINASLFSGRVAAGHIVDGHGDLHLRNMCLYGDTVVIFDCIEFSQKFRAGDVIADIAFLTMDLDARDLPHLGNCFLNEYLQRTDDYAGLSILDFYQSYRACVRGKIASFQINSGDSEAKQIAAAGEASRYFDLAEQYSHRRSGGLLITCGPSASGKTTVAHHTAEAVGAITVRADAVRKHLAGIQLEHHQTAPYGQGIYNSEMTRRTYRALLEDARVIINTGRWAILDATYLRREQRLQAIVFARALGTAFGIIYCSTPPNELARRLEQRMRAQQDISDATHALLQQQLHDFETPQRDEAELFFWTGDEDPIPWIRRLARAR
ncbi:MAG: bifunctional aminoglycoside phosphotransferase/ATP-binding protein [Acidiferrobacterales bacterium]